MPGRNIIKDYVPQSYYHVYNRGVNRASVFIDEQDNVVFLSLLKRYLGQEVEKKQNRTNHPNFCRELELLAYCLMNNHFHMLIYQDMDSRAIAQFMKSLSVAYGMYFNEKYKRVGPVFQQRYRAVRITDEAQYEHISRYIHMNPREYLGYEWSSLAHYTGQKSADWLKPGKIIDMFPSGDDYLRFLEEYKDRREELSEYKAELANA